MVGLRGTFIDVTCTNMGDDATVVGDLSTNPEQINWVV